MTLQIMLQHIKNKFDPFLNITSNLFLINPQGSLIIEFLCL